MRPAERIIDRFGGIAALARALGHRNSSTVQGWKERGVIPIRQIENVLAAARARGVLLSHADFFEQPERVAS
jgi:hypothetical protein